MATIKGLLTLSSIRILVVDSAPNTGAGVVAPVGSYAFLEDGSGAYFKQSSTDIDWRKVAFCTTGLNTQTGSYTLVLTDDSRLVLMNVGTANDLTVPPNSSVAFEIGTSILFAQIGAGQTTFLAGPGVTINSNGSANKLSAQYSMATLIKIGTDTWLLSGDITA